MQNKAVNGPISALTGLAKLVRFLLGAYLVACVLNLLFGGWLLFTEIRAGFGYASLMTTSLLSLICALLFFVSAVPIVMWFHRALRNLVALQLSGLRFTPNWSAASFFVPFANTIVPFQSMRELYNRSLGEDEYQALQSVGDVSTWWTSYLIGSLIVLYLWFSVLLAAFTNVAITAPTGANTAMGILATVLLATSAFKLFRIVGTISLAQHSITGIADTFA